MKTRQSQKRTKEQKSKNSKTSKRSRIKKEVPKKGTKQQNQERHQGAIELGKALMNSRTNKGINE